MWSEEIDCASFSVVPGPYSRFRALLWRQRIVDARDLPDHIRPSELVGYRLDQKRLHVHLGLGGLESEPVLIVVIVIVLGPRAST